MRIVYLYKLSALGTMTPLATSMLLFLSLSICAHMLRSWVFSLARVFFWCFLGVFYSAIKNTQKTPQRAAESR